MLEKPLVSVIVLTYNPDWIKFRNTLKSIIWQKDISFDVIICDDGSESDCFREAESFFHENGFSSFKLIKNTENQGTLKNTIRALSETDSKYVKMISPGDFLYDECTVRKFFDYAELNACDVCFGDMYYYSLDGNSNPVLYDNLRAPRNLRPWISNDYKKIRFNYLFCHDFVSGASLFCRRDVMLDYLTRLKDDVAYAEDYSLIWMLVEKKNILYAGSPIIFYEYGSGISTNGDRKWGEIRFRERFNLFTRLRKMKLISYMEFSFYASPSRGVRFLAMKFTDFMEWVHKKSVFVAVTDDVEKKIKKIL